MLVLFPLVFHTCILSVFAASRTSPPYGAIVVDQKTTTSRQFKTLKDAIASLPDDSSPQTIFMYPATYNEKETVLIQRDGPVTILGYTKDTMDFNKNRVVIAHSASKGTAGSNDKSGTLRIYTDRMALYNIDVRNDFGVAAENGQAVALSQNGNKFGAYACRFYSYQDTLYANIGTQVYLKSYIEGAVDFICGRLGQAYFEGNTLASKGAGAITASGRQSDDSGCYVFDKNRVVASANAFANVTGNTFLGRPWGNYAKAIFKNTDIGSHVNKALWTTWTSDTPNTDHVLFAEYNSTGTGVANAHRPVFAKILTPGKANKYNIASAVGSDYREWVDKNYLS